MPLCRWTTTICLLALSLLLPSAATPAAAQEIPRFDISAGYSLLSVSRGFGIDLGDVKQTLHGWYADVSANESRLLGIVVKGSGNYRKVRGQDVKLYEFAAGVRLHRRASERMVPFVQALVGVTHFRPNKETTTEQQEGRATNASLHLGGGVNLMAGARVGLRIGADYILVFTEGSPVRNGKRTHGLGVTAGIVFSAGG